MVRPVEIEDLEYIESLDGTSVFLDINQNLFLLPQAGLEWRADGGFLIGANAGYALNLNDEAYTVELGSLTNDEEATLDALYDSSFSISAYLGFYF